MAFTILLVDDSATIRAVLKRTFAMAKLPIDEIFEAGDGLQALDILKGHWVDVALCDINMPNMNGVELLNKMKANPLLRDIPVVIISTEGSEKRMDDLKKQGIAGYLRKPCRPEEIRDLLKEILGGWNDE